MKLKPINADSRINLSSDSDIAPEVRIGMEDKPENRIAEPDFYFEEKYDGSQLSFRLNPAGCLEYYNKNKPIKLPPNEYFRKAAIMLDTLTSKINPNFIYHGESITKLRHNVNVYERTPRYYFILFDVYDQCSCRYLMLHEKTAEGNRLNLECAFVVYSKALWCVTDANENTSAHVNEDVNAKSEELIGLISQGKIVSSLGGKLEGIVFKRNIVRRNKIVHTKLKMVLPEFRERYKKKQKFVKSRSVDELIDSLGSEFDVEARFQKALHHLNERSETVDLFALEVELDQDLEKEYKTELIAYLYAELSADDGEIKDALWSEYNMKIKLRARKSLEVWYRYW
jgi:hypothetical protein